MFNQGLMDGEIDILELQRALRSRLFSQKLVNWVIN